MKILYPFPEPLPQPKARSVQVAHMVKALCGNDHHVTLAFVPTQNKHPFSPIGINTSPNNLSTWPLSNHWPFPFSRWHSVRPFTDRLLHQLKKDKPAPDFILVRHLKIAEILLKQRPDIPLIYEAHEVFGCSAKPSKAKAIRKTEDFVLNNATGVVAISQAVLSALQQHYTLDASCIVLHSGVESPLLTESANKLFKKDWQNCHKHIIYAGSLYDWKGIHEVMQASALLPNHQFTVIGGTASEISQLQQRYMNSSNVCFLGHRSQAEVMAYLQEACIALLPNRAEGVSQFTSPLKLFEAIGMGCALVASSLPSVQEVLPSSLVYWCNPGDTASLVKAIETATNTPNHVEQKARDLYALSKKFTWGERARRLVDFATSLL